MATANPISSSCQSIARVSVSAGTTLRAGGNSNGNGGNGHYIPGTGSLGRLKYHNKHKSLDASDEEIDYSQVSELS